MTHEEQIARLAQARQQLATIFPRCDDWCDDCGGSGIDPGSLHEPEPCKRCAGTGNESRLVEEES